jgi:hypothetical protein
MEALGHREVVAVVFAGGYPQQMPLSGAGGGTLRTDRLGSAQR